MNSAHGFERLLESSRDAASQILQKCPALLIADLRVDWFLSGRQQVFCCADTPTEYCADFVVAERNPSGVNWQLIMIQSPMDNISRHGVLSAEFQSAIAKVDECREGRRRSIPLFSAEFFSESEVCDVSYRIVIGDSLRQSQEEREVVRSCRAPDLRIRSFRWLLEKPQHYSAAEIAQLMGADPLGDYRIVREPLPPQSV